MTRMKQVIFLQDVSALQMIYLMFKHKNQLKLEDRLLLVRSIQTQSFLLKMRL